MEPMKISMPDLIKCILDTGKYTATGHEPVDGSEDGYNIQEADTKNPASLSMSEYRVRTLNGVPIALLMKEKINGRRVFIDRSARALRDPELDPDYEAIEKIAQSLIIKLDDIKRIDIGTRLAIENNIQLARAVIDFYGRLENGIPHHGRKALAAAEKDIKSGTWTVEDKLLPHMRGSTLLSCVDVGGVYVLGSVNGFKRHLMDVGVELGIPFALEKAMVIGYTDGHSVEGIARVISLINPLLAETDVERYTGNVEYKKVMFDVAVTKVDSMMIISVRPEGKGGFDNPIVDPSEIQLVKDARDYIAGIVE